MKITITVPDINPGDPVDFYHAGQMKSGFAHSLTYFGHHVCLKISREKNKYPIWELPLDVVSQAWTATGKMNSKIAPAEAGQPSLYDQAADFEHIRWEAE